MPALPSTIREYHVTKVDGVSTLAILEAALPKLRATDVLVKIHAVSLNARDLPVSKGTYRIDKENVIPASDCAGEIVALGADLLTSRPWAPGDRVCASMVLDHIYGDTTKEIQSTTMGSPLDGVLAEYKAFPAHSLVRIPEHLSYEEASTLPCAALTAYNAISGPVPVKGGDTILIQGTGGVSIFALQFAVASGATVIATSSSDSKLEVAKSFGAHHLINYKATPDWDQEVLKITNGRGVDHVMEAGGMETIAKSIAAVRIGGWIHAFGVLGSRPPPNTEVSAQRQSDSDINIPLLAIMKAITLRGVHIGSVALFNDMTRLITAAKIRPAVNQVFKFEDAQKAYDHLESQTHVGKVVIRVSRT
ncbi:hypothetical protein PLICRDRAFT_542917 [Plicaturopsis crispa FD-325 SS-3]|nr:hypothetical protein PLICRDRAFT_542917 [Plicaturopsis crispa FD-325 SS-3]